MNNDYDLTMGRRIKEIQRETRRNKIKTFGLNILTGIFKLLGWFTDLIHLLCMTGASTLCCLVLLKALGISIKDIADSGNVLLLGAANFIFINEAVPRWIEKVRNQRKEVQL